MKFTLSLASCLIAFVASIQASFHWGGSAGLPQMDAAYSALLNGLLAGTSTYLAPRALSHLSSLLPKRVPVVASVGFTEADRERLTAVYRWVMDNTARANTGKVPQRVPPLPYPDTESDT